MVTYRTCSGGGYLFPFAYPGLYITFFPFLDASIEFHPQITYLYYFHYFQTELQ